MLVVLAVLLALCLYLYIYILYLLDNEDTQEGWNEELADLLCNNASNVYDRPRMPKSMFLHLFVYSFTEGCGAQMSEL